MSRPHTNRLDDPQYRVWATRILFLFLSISISVLVLRLFYLQIIEGGYHKSLSEQNSIRLQVVKAPRGLIYDRNGTIIGRNRASYQIEILPTELKNPRQILKNLCRFKDAAGKPIFDSAHVAWSLDRARWRKFQPLLLLEDAPFEVVSLIEEHQADLPGVVTLVESRRSYPFGSAAGHALGYMDEVNEKEVGTSRGGPNSDSTPYQRGDRVGRKGLERQYENYFRGRDGIRYVKVNAFGKQVEVIDDMPRMEPEPGQNVYTTLDMDLQVYAESLLADSLRGAIVALDPRNGEVLVMASSPRIDGNIFSLGRERRSHEWANLALDPDRPLNNRAISGGYEPGSTFKGIVSVAALQSGKITAEDHMARSCGGGYRFGNRVWKCWDPKGHGYTKMVDAFTQSCDVYFYQAGLIVGMDPINKVAREFGFGQKSGIDLDEERSGLLMDSVTYEGMYGGRGWRWSRGMVLNLAIGQGQIATPLQLADYAAGLANGSAIYRPHLLREVRDPMGRLVVRAQPEVLHKIDMTPEQHATLLEAMAGVVNSPHGTAARARVPGILVGGKTGSAENPHGDKTHALFFCAAPLDNPRIVVAVIIENVGHGGSYAAPIAGAILRRYFHAPG